MPTWTGRDGDRFRIGFGDVSSSDVSSGDVSSGLSAKGLDSMTLSVECPMFSIPLSTDANTASSRDAGAENTRRNNIVIVGEMVLFC